jgi:hypothetical protein
MHNGLALACTGFRLSPVRSPLLGASMALSLPGVTKMFQLAPLASDDYEFIVGSRGIDPRGVPAFGDPRISGCLAPPRGLSQPTTSFVASQRQSILRTPLLA